jgi:hypothetical protein
MITFNFNVANPWSRRWENLWNQAYKTPFKNKFVELEVIKDASIVSFNFRFTTRTDHSGLYVSLGLLGYDFGFNFYDSRHWDEQAGRYYVYNKAGELH